MNILGIMSGTSLDGLDLAHCRFERDGTRWHFRVLQAATIPYDDEWRQRLATAHTVSGLELARLDRDFGRYIGACCKAFAGNHPVDLIASHGHTVFHLPDERLTLQIGNGNDIAAVSGIRTIADFRRQDVAIGGQGAPLVPIGDELLFPEYTACLNLGGFANISFRKGGRRIAFDIGPFNMIFNRFAARLGLPYDDGGRLARSGRCDEKLLKTLDALPYYTAEGPKSLGREWVDDTVMPLLEQSALSSEDLLQTWSRHIVGQTIRVLPGHPDGTLLVTGGGAFNTYAMDLLRAATPYHVVIPDADTVNYKEAIIFAFLGQLRADEQSNTLAAVTGAPADHSGGTIFLPPPAIPAV